MKVNITYFGMEGQGNTMTDAKKDAGRKIEEAMTGSYQPVMLQSRGIAVILWRDPQGWRYNTITDEQGKLREDAFRSYCSGRTDYYEEYASALLHLAQMTWDGQEERPPCLDEVSTINSRHTVNDNAGRRLLGEFKSWRGFQLAYRHAKASNIGNGDCEWHRWACDHASEFAA